MNESALTVKLEKTLDSVERIEGVDGTLLVDNQGEILYSSILSNDVSLFGSMANIISNSSEKLLGLSNQGSGERILVESARGKALFLSLEKAHLVVLTHIKANIGMIMISSKRAVEEIKQMDEIKELPDYVEEILEEETLIKETEVSITPETEISESPSYSEPLTEESDVSEAPTPVPSENAEISKLKEAKTETATSDILDTEITEITEDINETEEVSDFEEEKVEPIITDSEVNELEITSPPADSTELETTELETEISTTKIESKVKPEIEGEVDSEPELEIEAEKIESDILPDKSEREKLEVDTVEESIVEPSETIKDELDVEEEIKGEEKVEEKIEKPSIPELPVIKPPLSFPPLPENVEVPDNLEDKSKLIIDIYESILLAMSIGASKIMGVAPARGMLKKSLPYEDCKDLLEGVDVKSNSSLNFKTIIENLEKIPIEKRSEQSITDFTALISAITDNYGRVMGYDAFRGMIRPEFKKIYDSYGLAMESLGIKEKIHPELRELLVS